MPFNIVVGAPPTSQVWVIIIFGVVDIIYMKVIYIQYFDR